MSYKFLFMYSLSKEELEEISKRLDEYESRIKKITGSYDDKEI